MRNTERLFNAMKDFTDKRRANRETFLKKKNSLRSYQGSAGYQKDISAAMKIRNDADEEARKECEKIVNEVLSDMLKKNGERKIEAPTDEQVRILTVAQMLKKPSKAALDSIANSLDGNALSLAALTDIAREAWKDEPNVIDTYITNYEQYAARALSAQVVTEAIAELRGVCSVIRKGSGANRIREYGAEYHVKHYGAEYDPDELPQEEPYTTEREFYKRELNGVDYDLFAAAVN